MNTPEIFHIAVCMKPLDGNFAENVLKHETGGLNIDGCRIEFAGETDSRVDTVDKQIGAMGKGAFGKKTGSDVSVSTYKENGRFPANIIHDGSEEVTGLFPDRNGWSGQNHNNFNPYGGNSLNKSSTSREGYHEGFKDGGSSARFFKQFTNEMNIKET